MAPKGSANPRWNGGISEYPNHGQMKRNRLIKLKEADGKCEVCGSDAYCIHHLDGSRDNHELENLAVVCRKCHGILHTAGERANSNTKYVRLYGLTCRQMSEKYGGTSSRYHYLHIHNRLKDFLESQIGNSQ